MPRRGENIRKRCDGRWEGRYKSSADSLGKANYRSVYGKTYGEVKGKLEMYKKQEKKLQTYSEGTVTFCDIAEQWLAEIKRVRKYSSYVKYYAVYSRYIRTQLAGLSVTDINTGVINERIHKQENQKSCGTECGLSDSVQKSIYCVINQTLFYASVHFQYPHITLKRSAVRNQSKPIEILNHSEQEKLLRYLYREPDMSKVGIILCLSTGLRLGEVCSLKWEDIDFNQGILHVNSTVQRIAVEDGDTRTILLETSPKSAFSKREIPLPTYIISMLLKFKGSSGYCLVRNRPMEPRTYQNHFKAYLREVGVQNYKFHVLRHTFATNCIDNGMDVKCLSEILGHSDVQITLNRYVHPTMDTKRKYLEVLSCSYGRYSGLIL